MRKIFFIMLPLLVLAVSCKNKELVQDDPCFTSGWSVLVRMNWEDRERDARQMRMSLFSQNTYPTLDRETVDRIGHKSVKLPIGCCYQPVSYDYYAKNIYFRNETDCELLEAYSLASTRATYTTRATPVEGESTVSEPGSFHMDAWDGTFEIETIPAGGEELIIDFYPRDVMREFTYCIRNVAGARHISQARGAISGMAASIFISTGRLNDRRSTVLFENAAASDEAVGTITGRFYTFGPLEPYSNRFTIETISRESRYFTSYWDVSGQITESMADRDAKLARDGYDILIDNDPNEELPPIPASDDPDYDSGFRIDIGEWDDVVIYL